MQKLLIDAGKYAQEKVLKYQIEQADAAKKYLIDNGLQVSQLEDEDVWKKAAMEKVWPEMADFVGGKETINAYLKGLRQAPLEVTPSIRTRRARNAPPGSFPLRMGETGRLIVQP